MPHDQHITRHLLNDALAAPAQQLIENIVSCTANDQGVRESGTRQLGESFLGMTKQQVRGFLRNRMSTGEVLELSPHLCLPFAQMPIDAVVHVVDIIDAGVRVDRVEDGFNMARTLEGHRIRELQIGVELQRISNRVPDDLIIEVAVLAMALQQIDRDDDPAWQGCRAGSDEQKRCGALAQQ